MVQNIVLVWPGSKVLLKGCLDIRFTLESIDKIIHSISAQITVGFWLYYTHEEKNFKAAEAAHNRVLEHIMKEKWQLCNFACY